MKKLTALMLALVMLATLCLSACGDDEPKFPVDGTGTGAETDGGAETDNGAGNDKPDEWTPDPSAGFGGYLGIGAENGTVYFDDLKVVGTQGKFTLIERDFEEDTTLDYTFKTAAGGTWTANAEDWKVETIETPAETEGGESTFNNALAITTDTTGSMMTFGDNDWNMLQLSAKVKVTEGTGGVKFYFGVTDENNYYMLDIGNGDNSSVAVKHCVDGVVTSDTIDLVYALPVDTWFPVSLNIAAATVKVYVNGIQLFEAYETVSEDKIISGGIGFGTWSTMYSIDNVKVTSYLTGDVLYENDFSNEALSDSDWTAFDANDGEWTTLVNGEDWHNDWAVVDDDADHGKILQLNYVSTTMTGGAIMVTESIGNPEWNNYIFEFDARRDGGAEGFMPYFAVTDVADPAAADFIRWNQGGWTNTQTCFQVCVGGSLTNGTQTADTYANEQWYHVTIYVIGNAVYGCVDGQLLSVYIK